MNKQPIDGIAIVYCEGAFNTTNGKTAHGLVRFTERYRILSVIDSRYAGKDAGQVLDGRSRGIPVAASLKEALDYAHAKEIPVSHLVMGLAPDGGKLDPDARKDMQCALENGLNIDSGLHDFLSEDPRFSEMARANNCVIRDIRKPPDRKKLHFFSGKIEQVDCLKLAVLGTDSAVGKRTTAWKLVHEFREAGFTCEMVGTGQTAWMQGAKYCLVMDSLINDFVSGEIEHAVHSAWLNEHPDVIIIEGQGSLMNPAYPGGFEVLAAGRPDYVILQHAPRRLEYDGFPGYPLHPLKKQIEAIELISGKEVVAVTVNHEGMATNEIHHEVAEVHRETGLPAFDVLVDGPDTLVTLLVPSIKK